MSFLLEGPEGPKLDMFAAGLNKLHPIQYKSDMIFFGPINISDAYFKKYYLYF